MAVTYGFYNSVSGDRKYSAEQMSAIFNYLITDGVLESMGDALRVDVGTGRQVIVRTGWAWFDSTWTLNDNDLPLAISTPDVSYARIDAVVIEVNKTIDKRMNSIKIVTGVPSSNPVKPRLDNTTQIRQHAIAYVTVRAGATSITAADIERMVGKSACPYITGILQTVSVQSLFNQWEADYNKWSTTQKNDYSAWITQRNIDYNTWKNAALEDYETWSNQQKTDYQNWLDANQADFDEWFEHIQLVLSEDVVANLQLQIDKNIDDIEQLKSLLSESVKYADRRGIVPAEDWYDNTIDDDKYMNLYNSLLAGLHFNHELIVFTESGNAWFLDNRYNAFHVMLMSGGSGGGGSSKKSTIYFGYGGAGGDAGNIVTGRLRLPSSVISITPTVGSGGTGGANTGGPGGAGGESKLSSYITTGFSMSSNSGSGSSTSGGAGGKGGNGPKLNDILISRGGEGGSVYSHSGGMGGSSICASGGLSVTSLSGMSGNKGGTGSRIPLSFPTLDAPTMGNGSAGVGGANKGGTGGSGGAGGLNKGNGGAGGDGQSGGVGGGGGGGGFQGSGGKGGNGSNNVSYPSAGGGGGGGGIGNGADGGAGGVGGQGLAGGGGGGGGGGYGGAGGAGGSVTTNIGGQTGTGYGSGGGGAAGGNGTKGGYGKGGFIMVYASLL